MGGVKVGNVFNKNNVGSLGALQAIYAIDEQVKMARKDIGRMGGGEWILGGGGTE